MRQRLSLLALFAALVVLLLPLGADSAPIAPSRSAARLGQAAPLTLGIPLAEDPPAIPSSLYLPLVNNQWSPGGEGYLEVSIASLPSGEPADVTVVGPAPATSTYHLTSSDTRLLPAGNYDVTAAPIRVGASTYHPIARAVTASVSNGSTSRVTVDYLIVVPDTTKVLDSSALSQLASASPDYSTLTFAESRQLPTLAIGDDLAAGVSPETPRGLLRKVTSLSRADDQLGDGTTASHVTPIDVPGVANASTIAAGFAHTCALSADGTVRCWGVNIDGQLGDGTLIMRLNPVQVIGFEEN